MGELKYSAGMVSRPFWFHEFKKTARLMHDGMSISDIKTINRNENIYGAPTEYRASQIFNCVTGRIKAIGSKLLKLFAESDLATEKVIALLAIMKTDRLFFEFMYEVYREKLILGDPNFTDSDLNVFFSNKRNQNDRLARWTNYTVKRLIQCYTRVLFEAGLIDNSNEPRKIIRPLLDSALENYLKQNNMIQYAFALTGEE